MNDESRKAIALAEHAEQHQNERTRRIALALVGAMVVDGPFNTAEAVLVIRMVINRLGALCQFTGGPESARVITRALEALRTVDSDVDVNEDELTRLAAHIAHGAAECWSSHTLAMVNRLEGVLHDFDDEAPLCIGEAVMALAALVLSLSRASLVEEPISVASTERALVLAIGVLDLYEVKFDKELN